MYRCGWQKDMIKPQQEEYFTSSPWLENPYSFKQWIIRCHALARYARMSFIPLKTVVSDSIQCTWTRKEVERLLDILWTNFTIGGDSIGIRTIYSHIHAMQIQSPLAHHVDTDPRVPVITDPIYQNQVCSLLSFGKCFMSTLLMCSAFQFLTILRVNADEHHW